MSQKYIFEVTTVSSTDPSQVIDRFNVFARDFDHAVEKANEELNPDLDEALASVVRKDKIRR